MIKNEYAQQEEHHCGSENRKGDEVVPYTHQYVPYTVLISPPIEPRLQGC